MKAVVEVELADVQDMLACVHRECALRRHVYPKWIAEGRLEHAKAAIELRDMARVAWVMEELRKQFPSISEIMAREEACPGSTAALCSAVAIPFVPPAEYSQPLPRPRLRLTAPRPRASIVAPLLFVSAKVRCQDCAHCQLDTINPSTLAYCDVGKDYQWPDLLRVCKDFAPGNA